MKSKKQIIEFVVAAAILDADGRVLLARRPYGKKDAGLWEFPGGKIETGETPEQAIKREIEEEINLILCENCLQPVSFASHRFNDQHLVLLLFICRNWSGFLKGNEGQELSWTRIEDVDKYPLCKADLELADSLIDIESK